MNLIPLLGFRHDPFLPSLLGADPNPRSASIHLGYLSRQIALEQSAERWILDRVRAGQKFQVVSCGAGFDMTFFKLWNLGIWSKEGRYIEVDFHGVINEKRACLQVNELAKGVMSSLDNGEFTTLACDLCNVRVLESKLGEVNVRYDVPTMFVSECVLTYAPVESVNELLIWIARKFQNVSFFNYEQIRPNDFFGRKMRAHFINRGCPIFSIVPYPSPLDQRRRLWHLGLKGPTSMDLVACNQKFWLNSEHERTRRAEPYFDEFEELLQKTSHYTIVQGNSSASEDCPSVNSEPRDISKSLKYLHYYGHRTCKRYGHLISVINEDCVLLLGGYADDEEAVKPALLSLDLTKSKPVAWTEMPFNRQRRIFGATAKCNQMVYVFGGRAAPDEALGDFWALDFTKNLAQKLELKTMPKPRWKHTLTAIDDSHLVLIGGRDTETVFQHVWLYSTTKCKWRRICKLPMPLFSHSSAAWKGKVIVSGGIDSKMNFNTSLYLFEPLKHQVMRRVSLDLTPRLSHNSFVTENSVIYLMGGVTPKRDCGATEVDLVLGTVKEESEPQSSVPLYSNTGAFINGQFLMVGGGGNCFSFGMHITNQITIAHPML